MHLEQSEMTLEQWLHASEGEFLHLLEIGQMVNGVRLSLEATAHHALFDYGRASHSLVLAEQHFAAAEVLRWLRRDRWVELDRWADDGGRAS